jgi:hypothetical protein
VQGTVSAICADPDRPGVAYAAHYGQIYEFHATAGLWRRISPEQSAIHSIKSLATTPTLPGHVFALTNRQGIFALEVGPQRAEGSINKH